LPEARTGLPCAAFEILSLVARDHLHVSDL
jgi:hypothetical protein